MGAGNFLAKAAFVYAVSAFSQSDSAQVAQSILSSFSSSCPSVGSFSRQAVAQANSLVETLRGLRDDPDCKSLSGAISGLNRLEERVNRITSDNVFRAALLLQRSREEILLQISVASDAMERRALQSELLRIEVEIARNTGEAEAQEKFQNYLRQASAAQALVSTTQTLLSQALANQNCLIKYPSLLTGFAQIAGAVASAFAGPGASFALSASVDLIGSLVEYVRVSKINSQIDRVSSGILSTAMQCGMEALSQQYCSATDAFHLVKLKAESVTSSDPDRPVRPPVEEGILYGLHLLEVDTPYFLDWLQRVSAGEDPSNAASADRQTNFNNRENAVKNAKAQGLGVINDRVENYEELTKQLIPSANRISDIRWAFLRTTMSEFLNRTPLNGPLTEIFPAGYIPYFILGFSDGPELRDSNQNYLPIDVFDPDKVPSWTFPVGLKELGDRFEDLLEDAERLIDQERSRIFITDPLGLIVTATQGDITDQSPYASMLELKDFFANRRPAKAIAANPALARLFDNTVIKLSQLIHEIDCVTIDQNDRSCPQPPKGREQTPLTVEEKASLALANIQRIAKLDNGLTLFSERVRWAIRISLNELLLEPGAADLQTRARLLAAEDIIRDIKSASGADDFRLKADIDNALSVSQGTLAGFVDVFGPSLAKTLKTYDDQARQAQEKPDGPNLNSKAALCLKLASAPVWPDDVSKKFCLGTRLKGVYFFGPLAPVVTEELLSKPFEERVCLFRDFSRRSRIYERFSRNPLP